MTMGAEAAWTQGTTTLLSIIIAQAFFGVVFVVGFVAVLRRFMDKEVPGLLKQLNDRVDGVQKELEKIEEKLDALDTSVTRLGADHEARIRALENARRPAR